jgi:hypothetical protein
VLDESINLLKSWYESFIENGTSYALIVGSIIGLTYFELTLIDFGTPGSAFRLSHSMMNPFSLLTGIGLFIQKFVTKIGGYCIDIYGTSGNQLCYSHSPPIGEILLKTTDIGLGEEIQARRLAAILEVISNGR